MLLALGWTLHGVCLGTQVLQWGESVPAGMRLGFAAVLSLTVWLMLAVHAVESRWLPSPGVRRALALAAASVVALAAVFPGEVHRGATPWAPVHWLFGVASYGLLGAAVLHALMLDMSERQLRSAAMPQAGPLGMPLLRLERLTFGFVQAGFGALSATIVLGILTSAHWRWDHKNVFALLAWIVLAALLAGRYQQGWRGRRATRWLYVAAVLLLLAYAGSRFVLEVLLGRSR